MSGTAFWKSILIISLIAFFANMAMVSLPDIRPFSAIAYGSLLFFVVVTVAMFYTGKAVTGNKNKSLYIGVVQLVTGFKIMLSLAFVILFVKLKEPPSNWFIVPFLLNYVLFTVFETVAMMRVGKEKTTPV